jgi:flagellar hook protein FlgE
MANALQTGVSGLNSHSQLLDVIGNNIANINTTGYKAKRAVFSDLLYQTLRSGTGGTPGSIGGSNPSQVGSGSRVSQIAVNTTQGNFESTSDPLNVAIDGDGMFVVQSPLGPLYTRAGAFGIDESGILVDPGTGYRVQRFGSLGDPNGTGPAFQVPGSNDIRIPLGAIVAGKATTAASISGNLPSSSRGALAQALQTVDPLTAGGTPVTATTLLNQLDLNTVDYVAGDALTISGTDSDGSPVLLTVPVGPTTTMGDVVNAINSAYSSATASLDANGRLHLTADATGPSFLSFALNDDVGNTGSTSFQNSGMIVSQQGKDADVRGEFQVFDSRGAGHNVQLAFEKQVDGTWNLTASMPNGAGTIIDGQVNGIRFTDDGKFALVSGSGVGTAALTMQFAGQSSPQTINLTFGTPGTYDGLTNVATEAILTSDQDGYGVGSLLTVQIDGDGVIRGIASNGVQVPLAQLAIASFPNQGGLEARGQSYMAASVNSGSVVLGAASAGGRGSVVSRQLEQSNVDLAYEFTRLIVAQRGFSANARTITVADEILRELTGLVQ